MRNALTLAPWQPTIHLSSVQNYRYFDNRFDRLCRGLSSGALVVKEAKLFHKLRKTERPSNEQSFDWLVDYGAEGYKMLRYCSSATRTS